MSSNQPDRGVPEGFDIPAPPPPPAWLNQAMEEGWSAYVNGRTAIPTPVRENLPPKANLPGAAPKQAAPAPPPAQQQRRPHAPAPPPKESPARQSATKADFDVFSESMTGSKIPDPPKPVNEGGAKGAGFRADWAPVIVDNLVESKGRTAGIVVKDPVSGVVPIPAKKAAPADAEATPPPAAPTPAPAPRVYAPVSRANSAEERYRRSMIRRSRGAAFLGTLAIFATVIAMAGMASVRDGLPFVGEATFANIVAIAFLTPFYLLATLGQRWASWIVLVLTTLVVGFSMIVVVGLGVWFKHLAEVSLGVTLPTSPILSLLSYATWIGGTYLLLVGLPKDRRFYAGIGSFAVSVIVLVIALLGSGPAKLANSIIKAPESVLGDPASGYSFRKPEGWEGFRWNDKVKAQLLSVRFIEPATTEIFVNESQSLAFFYTTSVDGPGEDEVSVPPSLANFLTGITRVDRSSEEIKGAVFYTCWGDIPASPRKPAVFASTATTEIETGWLHVTMVGHVARLGGEEAARETVTKTLRRILVTFDVDTPPPS